MKFLGLNMNLCGEILKLRKLRKDCKMDEYKKLKKEIMQTYNICEKTVYNLLNSERPTLRKRRTDIGSKHKTNYWLKQAKKASIQNKHHSVIKTSEARIIDIFAELSNMIGTYD